MTHPYHLPHHLPHYSVKQPSLPHSGSLAQPLTSEHSSLLIYHIPRILDVVLILVLLLSPHHITYNFWPQFPLISYVWAHPTDVLTHPHSSSPIPIHKSLGCRYPGRPTVSPPFSQRGPHHCRQPSSTPSVPNHPEVSYICISGGLGNGPGLSTRPGRQPSPLASSSSTLLHKNPTL